MKTILAAILGGLAVFGWGAVSWMALQWHVPTMKAFANEEQVTQVLTDNAPVSGIYVMPNPQQVQSTTHPEEAEKAQEEARERMRRGPFVFVSFSREGMDPQMKREMPYAIALNIIVALLIIVLLKATDDLGYFGRVLFVTAIGIVIALGGVAPNWIWWRFSTEFTLLNFADTVIGWLIAGLIIAALTGEAHSRLGATYRRRI